MFLEEIADSLMKYDLMVLSWKQDTADSFRSDISIQFSHESYPNFEAHLFAIADAAGWIPRLSSSGELELSCTSSPEQTSHVIDHLMYKTHEFMDQLSQFRKSLSEGIVPSFIWAHHEFRWHRFVWDSSIWDFSNFADFIGYVDESIRPHIQKLNELGFVTKESCSGMKPEHPDREPYWPYIMFDERAYPGIAPHLFTLADIASWDAKYAPHNFDVYLTVQPGDEILEAFDRIVSKATMMRLLLKGYFQSDAISRISHAMWRSQSFSIEG